MKVRFLAILLAILFLPVMAVAQNNIAEIRYDAPELAAHGEYSVGVQTLEFVNPDQLDIVNIAEDGTIPTYDRPLTVEVWYPAIVEDGAVSEYTVTPRNPDITATLTGLGIRDAELDSMSGPYPLVVMSHGYPGNRYLMSHLGENLATKGYIVVSIDHTDSTYSDQAAFGSTLYNRTLDQHFVIESIIALSNEESGFLSGMVDAENVGLIGYSMGGYGAVTGAGGAITDEAAAYAWGAPNNLLTNYQPDNDMYQELLETSRVKAVVAFAPWGFNTGFWNADTLAGIKTPFFFVAGDADDVSGYENGTRGIWENAVNADRYLLTLENARHNAGAGIPAPVEIDNFDQYMHYTDNVWNTTRMNNIAQHFVTAFLGTHLKGEDNSAYLDVVPDAVDGVYAVDDEGNFTDEHTYWSGFQDRTAIGLHLEFLEAGN